MGDLDAKRLLVENSKLKIQQNELSNVLGEEREMVKYLHGVIKNYEQLLRSNSKSKSSPRPAVVKRYHTDHETDPTKAHEEEKDNKIESESMKSHVITTHHQKGEAFGRLMPLSEPHRNKTPLSFETFLMRGSGEHSQGLSPYHGVNRPHIGKKNFSRSLNDLCFENRESSSSSDEDLVKDCRVSSSTHNIGQQSGVLNAVHYEKESSEDPSVGSVGNAPSRFNHKYNKEKHLGTHQEVVNPALNQNWYCCSKTSYDEIDMNKEGPSTNPRSNCTKTQERAINVEKELTEMLQELDRIESTLNKCEKSVSKDEKRLTKIENKMEYLESFALGKESEWL